MEIIQQTAQPAVTGTVRAGDTTISGTAEAGATVSVKRNGTEIGAATVDGATGAYTMTLNSGITLVELTYFLKLGSEQLFQLRKHSLIFAACRNTLTTPAKLETARLL